MNANELRIGNKVYIDLELIPGLSVHNFTKGDFGDLYNKKLKEDDYKPIPLTEEWLLKFGFDPNLYENIEPTWLSPQDDYGKRIRLFLAQNKKIYLWQYDIHTNVKIKHVHQLQNLYFALTGKELMVNIEPKQK